jgi:hypothetical protein
LLDARLVPDVFVTEAMVFQSTVPVTFGVLFTRWELGPLNIFSVVLALLSGFFVYVMLRRAGTLQAWHLMIGGLFYLVSLMGAVFAVVRDLRALALEPNVVLIVRRLPMKRFAPDSWSPCGLAPHPLLSFRRSLLPRSYICAGAFFFVAALSLSCMSTPSIGSSEQA